MPQWYVEQPPLLPGANFFFLAFRRLNTCRPPSFGGIGAIPWDKIIFYADRKGLDFEFAEGFAHVIMAMDDAFREDQRQHEEKRAKQRAAADENKYGRVKGRGR